ncbi:carboxymuconolactone decarboxylase family protein [Roseomonas sp. E05]|uniref:carboxymuconolactone decarboxylase family protein n=1 Tax=Roseomonas sp. E05 TaxID=3046310 RepID=UPI0024BB9EC8|nr:carboxymuconolactone decarboxylase family protein [Roseomonas sp. E05]MDJ0387672.1 carboxymuconolactone decarboxylase family protein [Roseomonas sp. E05]
MTPRLNPHQVAPEMLRPMLALEGALQKGGLEPSLVHLVKTRASQINGCAFCLHMHTAEARADGESEQRLYLLDAWRESPLYTPRERAALTWTEALTRVAETHAPDADYAVLSGHFSPQEQVVLTLMIGTINSWNRLAIGFRYVHPVPETAAAHAA